jgi:hypothetical protein
MTIATDNTFIRLDFSSAAGWLRFLAQEVQSEELESGPQSVERFVQEFLLPVQSNVFRSSFL